MLVPRKTTSAWFPWAAVRCQRLMKYKREECVQTVEDDGPANRRPAQDAERPPVVPSVRACGPSARGEEGRARPRGRMIAPAKRR